MQACRTSAARLCYSLRLRRTESVLPKYCQMEGKRVFSVSPVPIRYSQDQHARLKAGLGFRCKIAEFRNVESHAQELDRDGPVALMSATGSSP
jgi:hypothetical protein